MNCLCRVASSLGWYSIETTRKAYMSSKTIRDAQGRIRATIHETDTRTYLHDFTTGKVLATYNEKTDRTLDLTKNQQSTGNQIMRFIK